MGTIKTNMLLLNRLWRFHRTGIAQDPRKRFNSKSRLKANFTHLVFLKDQMQINGYFNRS